MTKGENEMKQLDYIGWSTIKDDEGKQLEKEMENAIKNAAQIWTMFRQDPAEAAANLDLQNELNQMTARVFKALDSGTSLIVAGLAIEVRRMRTKIENLETELATLKSN